MRHLFRKLWRDEDGVSSFIFAGSALAMVGAGALAVDFGNIYFAKRRLQGIADAAALSISEGDYTQAAAGANEYLIKDNAGDVQVVSLAPGVYNADASITPSARFTPSDASAATAMQVTMSGTVPLSFGAVIFGQKTVPIQAKAIAYRADLASFLIGTNLVELGGNPIGDQLLSALAGTELGFTTADVATLGANQTNLLALASRLQARLGLTNTTFGQVFSRTSSLSTILMSAADATADTTTADLLRTAAGKVGNQTVQLSRLVDLGPLGQTDLVDTANPLPVSSYTLLRSLLQLTQGNTWSAQSALSAAGLASAQLQIWGNNGTVQSPMMTVSAARNVVLRTAETRVALQAGVATAIPGIATLTVPVVMDLAPGQAQLTNIVCSGDAASQGVTLGVTPGIATLGIGAVDPATIGDMSQAFSVQQAALATTPLLQVTGQSEIDVGGNASRSVFFRMNQIGNGTTQSVATSDAVSAVAASLTSKVKINVNVLGLGVNVGQTSKAVGTVLSAAAPAIDGLLSSVLDAAGLGVGVTDTQVNRVRCGMPMLVG